MIGQTVSHYKIIEKLGEGGMGVVYKAEDTKLKRTVALKFLSPQAVGTEEDMTRFLHEARAAAALNHPNICTIYEIDEYEDQSFIAMECVEGESLKSRIETGPLSLDEAERIASQVAAGLREAHSKGIIHRDIKPANIMITPAGQAKIMDFGLAKLLEPDRTQLTKDGTTVGTVAYMAPEQARGDGADQRSDIWSLGVVMYEMIAGTMPFKGGHEQAIMYSILNEDPQPLANARDGVPASLASIVCKCLEKDPSERYQRVDAMIDDLGKATAPRDGSSASSSRVGGLSMWMKAFLEPSSKTGSGGPPATTKTVVMRWVGIVVFCAVLAVIFSLIYPYIFEPVAKKTRSQTPKIAVLFFENLGPPEDEYFADGITEELIARLAKVDGLGVIARTSVARYKGMAKTIGDIGEELDVDYILDGSIRWQRVSESQSRVRITPQLIRVADETSLWAEVYQRDMIDIFAIQSEIAGQVAQALDIALLDPGEKGPRDEGPTANTDAYRAYLEGRFWWNKRSRDGFDKAIALFDEAIRIDPDYALAYAGKAECYCMLAIHLARPAEYIEIARAAAQKALELDDQLPEAHTALGWIAWVHDYDYEAAERSFRRAITIDSGYATVHNWIGVMCACLGRDGDAVDYMTRAQQLDPGSLIINRDLACVLSWVGKLDDAERQLEKTIAMDSNFSPAHAHLGRIYAANGMYDKALAEFEIIRKYDSEYFNMDIMLGYTYAKMGRRGEAEQILERMLANIGSPEGKASDIAFVHVGLGNTDEAFEWFEKSIENREFEAVLFDVAIWLDDLRQDPRFNDLRKKIGLLKEPN